MKLLKSKKPVWVENLESEREAWTDTLAKLDGYEDSEKWVIATERIKMINAILADAGYLKCKEDGKWKISGDTKVMAGVSIFQTLSYWVSDALGRLPNRDPFMLKPRWK